MATAVPATGMERRGLNDRAGRPWGRWSVRAAALSYLAVMLIIPLIVIFQDGLRGLRERPSKNEKQHGEIQR